MRFELYTEKTVRQCMGSLADRLEAKPTKTRLALDGKIEKGGKFSLAVTSKVARAFNRKTRMRGEANRSSGVTKITGYVPDGVPRNRVAIVMVAMVLVALVIIANGNPMLGFFAAVVGTGLYIPLVGDYDNSAYLYKELKRATKAKEKPPT